jgi:adenylate cyclase
MGTEIERKFLVVSDAWREGARDALRFRQGYLPGVETASVRVRVSGGHAWLNIKSATLAVSRREYEYPIPLADAEEILDGLCQRPLIEKTRHHVPFGGHLWEVDVFDGDNAGLVVAEIELTSPDEPFDRPPWVGAEVSHDRRYYNVSLVRHPFRDWAGPASAAGGPGGPGHV